VSETLRIIDAADTGSRREDHGGGNAQQQRGNVGTEPGHRSSSRTLRQRLATADRLLAPLLLFVSFYVATLMLLLWVRFPYGQWIGLISVSVATTLIVLLWEKGQWDLGFFVPARLALREFLLGSAWGYILVASAALLIVWTTGVHHEPGRGFPWSELAAVFVPAAVHEELLCRGYLLQKLYRWNRGVAILLIGLLFACLHLGNSAVSPIGLGNIFLGGILLGLAYARFERLWFPIGLHLAWNLVSGPLLGHEVSGNTSLQTVLIEVDRGPVWLTGGAFGIEGSVWMTAAELAGVALLLARNRSARLKTLNMMPPPTVSVPDKGAST